MRLSGRVIEEQKNYFIVDTQDGPVRARVKGTLKKNRQRVCSGDFVDIDITNKDSLDGLIFSIHKRTSFIKRPALANLTQLFFINTFKAPNLDLEALDRFLFSAEVYHITPFIVFNKIDLLDSEQSEHLQTIISAYEKTGYHVLLTSAFTGAGVEKLHDLCKNQVSSFTGLSGVGKSTLLSKIFPEMEFRIGNVSGTTGRGTHTTTTVTLIPLHDGGYIADTPGLSFVDIPVVPEDEVINYFPELECRIGQCRFNNCIHDGEPGCIIQELSKQNEIAASRLNHYHKIHQEMVEVRKQYRKEDTGRKAWRTGEHEHHREE